MLIKSTNEIIAKFKNAVKKYDDDCNEGVNYNGFFSTPNKDAINRKVAFLMLVASLTESSPEKTIKDIFMFYKDNSNINGIAKQKSRLIHYIEEALFNLADVKEEGFLYSNTQDFAHKAFQEASRQRSELERIVNSVIGKTSNPTSAIDFHNTF